jgi:iron complex outermembrane receptor protein
MNHLAILLLGIGPFHRPQVGTLLAATKGKSVVDTPKHMLRGEIAYDSDSFFGRIGANYMSKRYFTYTNALAVNPITLAPLDRLGFVPERVLVDATLGYRFDAGMRVPLELQLNATNLLDKKYVSTIGSNGFGNSGDSQTLLAGAPRQFFVTLKAGF